MLKWANTKGVELSKEVDEIGQGGCLEKLRLMMAIPKGVELSEEDGEIGNTRRRNVEGGEGRIGGEF